MVLLNKFCFCWSLENGVIVIAIFDILAVIGRIVTGIERTVYFPKSINGTQELEGTETTWEANNIFEGLLIALGVMIIISSMLLLYGSLKRKSFILLPWLIVIFTAVLLNIALLIAVTFMKDQIRISHGLKACFILQILFDGYFWMVVHSLYSIIKMEKVRFYRPDIRDAFH